MAREMADTALPRYKVDASGDLVPDLRAAAAIIYDPETERGALGRELQSQRSIASITKVMTATVFLENNPDLTQPVTIARSDVFQASTTHLHANDQRHGRRPAAPAAHRVGQRRRPRARARLAVRLRRLRRADEREGGRARPAEHALRRSVGPAVGQRVVRVRHGAAHHARVGGRAHRVDHADAGIHRLQRQAARITFHSTNHLLGSGDVDVRAGKTGFISKAGYCLATLLRLPAERRTRSRSSSSARVERRPLPGNAEPVQLGLVEGVDALRRQAADRRNRKKPVSRRQTRTARVRHAHVSPLHRRRVERQRRDRSTAPSPAAPRCARRTP